MELPPYPTIGLYGGGDSLRIARTNTQSCPAVTQFDIDELQFGNDWQTILGARKMVLSDQLAEIHHSTLVVQAVGGLNYNVFAQGWLFRDKFPPPPDSLGFSLYPLIGLFNAVNMRTGSEVSAAGLQALRFADQHTHFVREELDLDGFTFVDEAWHFGGGMAAFKLEDESQAAIGQLVVLDYESDRLSVTQLTIQPN